MAPLLYKCSSCHEHKPADAFTWYKSKDRPSIRRQAKCKECRKAYNKAIRAIYYDKAKHLAYLKERRARQPEKHKEKDRKYREALNDAYIRAYLIGKKGYTKEQLQQQPELIELQRLAIKLKRHAKRKIQPFEV